MPQLRDYQQNNMVIPARHALRTSKGVVVVGATGSGKTSCAAYMARGAVERGKRVLVIVHKQEIHGQMMETLHHWGVATGQIFAGKHMTRERCQVAMVQTLANRIDIIPYDFDMVIIDEGHHVMESNRWGRVLKHPRIKNAAHILFTATPQGRTNGAGLHPFADEIVQGVSTLQLIEDGWLVYPRIYKPDKEVTDNFKITRGDYDTKQQEEVFSRKKVVGDAFDHYHYYLNGAPQITACVSLRHAHETMKYYREQARAHKKEWTVAMIQGGKKYETQRRDAIAGLASGSVQVVMFVDVLGEGVDVPVCVGLQWIRKTTSLVNYLQFTGRILRPLFPAGFNQYTSSREERIDAIRRSPKPYGVILDHAGNYYTHGHPVIERTWGLDDTRTGRAVEQSAPVITTCPVCNSVWPGKPSKCPACGAVIEEERDGSRRNPEVIKGMLREVVDLEGDDLDRLARFTQNLDGLNEDERRKKMLGALRYLDRDRMRAVAQAVGYKKNWTDVMYRRLNIKAPAGDHK